MKNLFYQTGLFSLFFLLVACTPSTQEATNDNTTEKATPEMTTTTQAKLLSVKDTISLDSFCIWTDNWEKHGHDWMQKDTLNGFKMPLVDLAETLKEKGVASSRFYLGLRNTGKNGYEAKLVVVGVDENDDDMLDYSKGQYAYDVSHACPPFCDKKELHCRKVLSQ